jgi:hypothetical protein
MPNPFHSPKMKRELEKLQAETPFEKLLSKRTLILTKFLQSTREEMEHFSQSRYLISCVPFCTIY